MKITELEELLPPGTVLEIGRVTVLHGGIRFSLLSMIDGLLATRLQDQGIARQLLRHAPISTLFDHAISLAPVKGVPEEWVRPFSAMRSRHKKTLALSGLVSEGICTLLGGSLSGDPKKDTFGFFIGQLTSQENLIPQWHSFTLPSLIKFRCNLDAAANEIGNHCKLTVMHYSGIRKTAQPGVVADGSRLHFGPTVTKQRKVQRRRRAGKRARG